MSTIIDEGVELKPPVRGIDIVDSLYGDSVHLEWYDRETGEEAMSITYPGRSAAIDAMRRNAVEWEES